MFLTRSKNFLFYENEKILEVFMDSYKVLIGFRSRSRCLRIVRWRSRMGGIQSLSVRGRVYHGDFVESWDCSYGSDEVSIAG